MAVRVDMRPGWERALQPDLDRFLDDRLGPAIAGDARRLAPVDTGTLRDSIRHEVSGGVLWVLVGVDYGGDVECGTSRMAAQPFLRPALYRRRSA